MKKLTLTIFFLLCLITASLAQFTVSGSNGADGNYTSLTASSTGVFERINASDQSGRNIIITITSNSTAETGAVALGAGLWTSLIIFPSASGLTISGNLNNALISLDGADNVTINGSVNGTGSDIDLNIINNSTGTLASTIRFINSSVNNIIKYCNIKGSGTGGTRGIIFFATSASGNGNDGNIIENTNITGNITGRPVNAIYSAGTAGRENSGNTLRNNNIFDNLNYGLASNSISIGINNSEWTISGNSFYETMPFIPTGSATYCFIRINSITGVGFSLTANYLGGSLSSCGGSPWTKTNNGNNPFYGIYLGVGTSIVSNVQNNNIKNFDWNNSSNANWTGIQIVSGNVNIGTILGNNIGDSRPNGLIKVTANGPACSMYGINISSSGTTDCQNNNIESIVTSHNNINSNFNIYGIIKNSTAGTTTIINNKIGNSAITNSIHASSPSTGSPQAVVGISTSGTGIITISRNIIANLNNATTNVDISESGRINGIFSNSASGSTSISYNIIQNLTIGNANANSNQNASIVGISLSRLAFKKITGNLIYNLSNTLTSFVGSVIGIYFTGSTAGNDISGNFIYDLSVSVSSTSALLYGMRISSGSSTYSNNIISLGGNTNTTIYGIYETGAAGNNNNLYFNSVYIGGSPGSGTNLSYAFYSASPNNTRDFRNNIFVNARSTTGGTNLHYAAYITGTSGLLTCNYNDYFVSGTGGILGYYGGNRTVLPIVTGQDANSYAVDPVFANPGGILPTDYMIDMDLVGINGTGITTDFGGITRTVPTIGAWEGGVNRWQGSVDNHWDNPANWSRNTVPTGSNINVIFDINPLHHCYLYADQEVVSITNSTAYFLAANGHKLTITGDLILSGGGQIYASGSNSVIEFAGTTAQSIPAGAFFGNEVNDLIINNANNVFLNGTMNLMGAITATAGRLDAITNSPTVNYFGFLNQTIASNCYLNERVYNLTIDNGAGVTLNTDLTVENSLLINGGKILTITAPGLLTVNGTITNNAGTSGLIIKSDANGVDGKLINGTPSVSATVELSLIGGQGTFGPAFHYFVPPVVSMTFDNSSVSAASASLGLTSFDGDLVYYSESDAGSNMNSGWQYFDGYDYGFGPTTPFNTLESTKGYNFFLPANDKITFKGQLNAASHSYDNLSFTNLGWNLIGNPYPCNYDITGIPELTGSGDGIDNTIYFNHDGGYAYYNILTGGTTGYSNILPPMQGFFVEVTAAGSSVHLPAAFKTASAASPSRSKGAAATESIKVSKIKLVLNNGSTPDETIVCLIDNATSGFDSDYDARKLFPGGSTTPLIYTELNDVEYAINAVAGPASGTVKVPVTVVLKSSGAYSIDITEFENLEGIRVILKHGSTETDLKENSSYAFTSGPGTFKDFEIIFSNDNSTSSDDIIPGSQFKTWYKNNYVYISCPDELSSDNGILKIYDTQGRLAYDNNQIYIVPNQTIQIPVNLTNGVYILNILSNKRSFKSKVVVF